MEEQARIIELENLLQQAIQARDAALNGGPVQPPANPPPGAQHVINLKPERPPSYTGNRGDSLEAWIFQMGRYCHLLPVPEANRVAFAGTFLKGHAAMWWRTACEQIEQQPAGAQWDLFIAGLRAQFQPVNTTKTARTKLDNIKQRTSVLAYNTEVSEIMLQIPDMHEEDRIHAYLKGLKPQTAFQVAMQQPATLLIAQGLADTADAIQWHLKSQPQYQERRPYRKDTQGPTPMDLDAIGKLTNSERERLRKNGGCFRCRKTGHLARDCTLPNRQAPRINAIEEEQPEESGKE